MVTLNATYLDDLGRVRLTAGDLLVNVPYTLQRSTDGMVTWVDVRGGGNVSTVGVTVVDDYEYDPNVINHYRLIVPVFYDSFSRQLPPPVEEDFESLPLAVVITEGSLGDTHLNLPGSAGSRSSTPDAAALDITSDIDMRMALRLDDFLSGSACFISKAAVGNISYIFGHQAGNLVFRGSTTGAAVNVTATCNASIDTVLDYQRQWIIVRFTRVAATGVGTFYYTFGTINNAGPWTQLGDTSATTAGNLFSGNAPVWVGEDAVTGLAPMNGGSRQMQLRSSINGTVVANPQFSTQAVGAPNFVDSAGLTWTMDGSATISNAIQSSAPWARTTAQAHTGSWSLQSGTITDNQVSDAVITLPANTDSVSFWYRLDTQEDLDYLQVFAGSTFLWQDSGTQGWAQSTVDVTGSSTLTLRYYRNAAGGTGTDAVWVDDMVFNIAQSSGATWGTADTGQTYTITDVDPNAFLYVDNGIGAIGDSDPTGDTAQLHATTSAAAVNAEMTFSVVQPSNTLDVAVEYNFGLRGSGTNNYYEAQVIFRTGNRVAIKIGKASSGVYTALTSTLVVGDWSANIPWYGRYRVNGTGLMMKVWALGTDEPRDWQIFVSDTEFTTGSDLRIRGHKESGAAYEQWFGPIEVRSIPDTVAATASVTPVQNEAWLKSVAYPLFNQEIECTDWDALSYDSRVGLYDVKGRHEILAITDVGSSGAFGLTFVTRSEAANRAVLALLTFGGVLLLQPPGDAAEECPIDFSGLPEGYVVPTTSVKPHSIHGQPIWVWEVAFTEVAAMDAANVIPTTITWELLWAIIGEDGTWETVWATWPTWQDLWLTQGNIEDFG